MISDKKLKALYHYDPETGILTKHGKNKPIIRKDRNGYARLEINGKLYQQSRIAFLYMTGKWPKYLMDHKDGDPSNNRWENLRECTPAQNCMNCRLSGRNKTGFKGVFKRDNKYIAQIGVSRKSKFLGTFEKAEYAYEAYKKAAIEYFGEYARLN